MERLLGPETFVAYLCLEQKWN